MATLLYVNASPQDASRSFSRRVADAFIAAYKETHREDTVDTFDVWKEPLPEFGAVRASWKVKAMTGQPLEADELEQRTAIESVTHRFKAADKYVLAVPVWNFHVPYRLKHYLDILIQPGMTFGLDRERGWVGLLPSTRPVHIVVSSGGSYREGTPLAQMNFHTPYLKGILGFIGLTDVRVQTVDCTAYGAQVAEPITNQAIQEAMAAAQAF